MNKDYGDYVALSSTLSKNLAIDFIYLFFFLGSESLGLNNKTIVLHSGEVTIHCEISSIHFLKVTFLEKYGGK